MGKIRLLLLSLAVWGAIAGPARPAAAENAPRGATVEDRLDALDQRQRILERHWELDKESGWRKGSRRSSRARGRTASSSSPPTEASS